MKDLHCIKGHVRIAFFFLRRRRIPLQHKNDIYECVCVCACALLLKPFKCLTFCQTYPIQGLLPNRQRLLFDLFVLKYLLRKIRLRNS